MCSLQPTLRVGIAVVPQLYTGRGHPAYIPTLCSLNLVQVILDNYLGSRIHVLSRNKTRYKLLYVSKTILHNDCLIYKQMTTL